MKKSILIILILAVQPVFGQWEPCGEDLNAFDNELIGISNDTLFCENALGYFISTDNGISWQGKEDLENFAESNSVNGVLFRTTGCMEKSTDSGATWEWVNTGYEVIDWSNTVPELKCYNWFLTVENDTIYYGGHYGRDSIIVSADGGETFYPIKYERNIVGLNLIRSNGTRLFAGNMRGIYYYRSEFDNWKAIYNVDGYSDFVFDLKGENLFIGSSKGFYVSRDNGEKWTKRSEGLPSSDFTSIALDDKYVYVSIKNYKGLYRAPLDVILSVEDNKAGSGLTIYPNPAKEKIMVTTAPELTLTGRIEIFNLRGEKMASVEPQPNETVISTVLLAPGVYFVKMGNSVEMFVKE